MIDSARRIPLRQLSFYVWLEKVVWPLVEVRAFVTPVCRETVIYVLSFSLLGLERVDRPLSCDATLTLVWSEVEGKAKHYEQDQ